MNIYKTALNEVNCTSRGCRGSYVWELDVEGLTGLWWGRDGTSQREGGMENCCNWCYWLMWWRFLTKSTEIWRSISRFELFLFGFSLWKRHFFLRPLIFSTFSLWEWKAFSQRKPGSKYDAILKFGAVNHSEEIVKWCVSESLTEIHITVLKESFIWSSLS